MKVHRVLANAAVALLESVFKGGKVLDRELASAFANHPEWGKRDRAFLAETVFEVVRWRRALAFVAGDDDPASLCAAHWLRVGFSLPDWMKISGQRESEMNEREAALPSCPRAVRESIPDWLDRLGESELGSDWERELAALNQRAPVFLRANLLRGSIESTREWLASHGVETMTVEGLPQALRLPEGRLLPKPLRLDGRVEIQDAGSQCIVPMLAPRPGETILDACAGAGGKSLQIAADLRNQGELVAMDVVPAKLEELLRRSQRAGVTCLRTLLADPHGLAEELRGRFDRVLIDAPCSGLGTLRRQPDLKWRISEKSLREVRKTQSAVLACYADAARIGGIVVYATCSILPSENRDVAEEFCRSGEYRLLADRVVSPAQTGFDGFYAAVLERTS